MEDEVPHYDWLAIKFKELLLRRPEATLFDGLVYALVSLWRDKEPGMAEKKWNLYEALIAADSSKFSRELGIDRVTSWRWTKDYKLE